MFPRTDTQKQQIKTKKKKHIKILNPTIWPVQQINSEMSRFSFQVLDMNFNRLKWKITN